MEATAKQISNALGYSDMEQNNPHHFGTVNEHVQAVVEALPKDASSLLIVAALCHDLGKFDTVSINPKTGYSQFLKHADKSVEIFEANKEKLFPNLSKEDSEYVSNLIKLHDVKYSKQGKIQTMLESNPNGFAKDLLTLQFADIQGQSEFEKQKKLEEVIKFADNILKIGTEEQTQGILEVKNEIQKEINEIMTKENTQSTNFAEKLAKVNGISKEELDKMKEQVTEELSKVVNSADNSELSNDDLGMDEVTNDQLDEETIGE